MCDLICRLTQSLWQYIEDREVEMQHGMSRFNTRRYRDLSEYHEYWRRLIRNVAQAQAGNILSPGWAFSTYSGIGTYETYLASDTRMRSLYEDGMGGVSLVINQAVEKIRDTVQPEALARPLGGVMVYGYGKLKREKRWLDKLLQNGLLNKRSRIYLLDCSILYQQIYARSLFNPLMEKFSNNSIRTEIINIFDEPAQTEATLKAIREDLNPYRPAIHFLLGNTVSNVTPLMLQRLITTCVRPRDFVVVEYSQYDEDFFKKPQPDYTSIMARRAAAELFSVSEDNIQTVDKVEDQWRYLEIKVNIGAAHLTFNSMLRRNFVVDEMTQLRNAHQYSLVCSEETVNGVHVAVFRCSALVP